MLKRMVIASHGLTIETFGKTGYIASGALVDRSLPEDHPFNVSMTVVERMLVAHACAGIDISSAEYKEGLETVIEAIANKYGE